MTIRNNVPEMACHDPFLILAGNAVTCRRGSFGCDGTRIWADITDMTFWQFCHRWYLSGGGSHAIPEKAYSVVVVVAIRTADGNILECQYSCTVQDIRYHTPEDEYHYFSVSFAITGVMDMKFHSKERDAQYDPDVAPMPSFEGITA